MNPKDQSPGSSGGSSQWIKSNLVALGSAAVLSVYAAGYVRTRAAAQRFAVETDQRRPAAATGAVSVAHAATPEPAVADTVVQAPSVPKQPASAAPASNSPQPHATPAMRRDSSAPAARTVDSTTQSPPVTPPIAPPVVPPAAAVATPVTPPVNADSAEKAADKERVVFKDGVYSGWGTSRHGDIQASVEIKGGRIISAAISQCLTRYSCSWISALPPQVVVRQSADVDYVSGATQSTNAFYYAVLEALTKAK